MNQGELDELKCKIFLTYLRDSRRLFFGKEITQLGSIPQQNYGPFASAGCDITMIQDMNEFQIAGIAQQLGITKSPARAKADVYINETGISIKSLRAAPPAIVNHTARPGFENACRHTDANIADLDMIIENYWDLRLQGVIAEDTKINDPHCPFNGFQNVMQPILEYFIFTGTGSGQSKYQAEAVLEFDDPFNILTYKLLTPYQAVNEIWNNLVFSMRAKKGMPTNYNPDTYKGKNAESIKQWTREIDNNYRGALHIRTKK